MNAPWMLVLLALFLAPKIALALAYTHDINFTPNVVLRVTEQNYTQGCLTRASALVNGSSPGPEVRIKAGETTWIRVYNDMDAHNLTMHWHGLSQAASPFSDGTPKVSQWPIPPYHFFDYELHPDADDAGTYFYHSHVGFQAVTAAGSLIVEDQGPPPYLYDEERTIFLSDVFEKTDEQIEQGLIASPGIWSGDSINVLVNGQGVIANATGPGPNCSLHVTNIKSDTTYRFRFIGGTAQSFVTLAFQGHDNLTIIEADGQYTQPYKVDHLEIGSGQRYSILLVGKTAAEIQQDRERGLTKYFMQLETRETLTLTRTYSVLSYNDTTAGSTTDYILPPENTIMVLDPITRGFLDYVLRPLVPNDFPPLSSVTRRITLTVWPVVNGTTYWSVDGYSWTEADRQVPYLVDLYNDNTSPSLYDKALLDGGFHRSTKTFPAKIGEVLEIVIENRGGKGGIMDGLLDVHPFHAHGGHFYDLGSGNGTYNVTENEIKLEGTMPVKRDTTMLYRYQAKVGPEQVQGWRAWRIEVDNPGVWMIHCHVLQHMLMGMQTVWVFGNASAIRSIPYPDVNAFLSYGGSAYGNNTHWPTIPSNGM